MFLKRASHNPAAAADQQQHDPAEFAIIALFLVTAGAFVPSIVPAVGSTLAHVAFIMMRAAA